MTIRIGQRVSTQDVFTEEKLVHVGQVTEIIPTPDPDFVWVRFTDQFGEEITCVDEFIVIEPPSELHLYGSLREVAVMAT